MCSPSGTDPPEESASLAESLAWTAWQSKQCPHSATSWKVRRHSKEREREEKKIVGERATVTLVSARPGSGAKAAGAATPQHAAPEAQLLDEATAGPLRQSAPGSFLLGPGRGCWCRRDGLCLLRGGLGPRQGPAGEDAQAAQVLAPPRPPALGGVADLVDV